MASHDVPTHPIAKRTNGTGPYKKPHIDEKTYLSMYKESIEDPTAFWDKVRSSASDPKRSAYRGSS